MSVCLTFLSCGSPQRPIADPINVFSFFAPPWI